MLKRDSLTPVLVRESMVDSAAELGRQALHCIGRAQMVADDLEAEEAINQAYHFARFAATFARMAMGER